MVVPVRGWPHDEDRAGQSRLRCDRGILLAPLAVICSRFVIGRDDVHNRDLDAQIG